MNLYARRCRYPEAQGTSDNPIGPDNDAWLLEAINDASVIIAIWEIMAYELITMVRDAT